MTKLEIEIDQAIEDARERALAAYNEAQRLGMLRVGHPWHPIAQAIVFCGVVIANGDKTKFRTWGDMGPGWTTDIFEATWYVRRDDAERACLCDEDGWHILGVNDLLADAMSASQ